MKRAKKNKFGSILMVILASTAVIVVATCMFLALAPAKRTTKAQKYDLLKPPVKIPINPSL